MTKSLNKIRPSQLIAGLITAIIICAASPLYGGQTEDASFYFVQITDTHLGHGNHIRRTEKIVEKINALPFPVRCVVHTGDITHDQTADKKAVSRGMEIFSRLSVPIHFVAGNHDILESDLSETKAAYVRQFGPLLDVHTYSGVSLITVYTDPLAESFSIKDFDPLKQLESALKSLDGGPAVVFHHHPSVMDFYKNRKHDGWERKIQSEWTRLLNTYNVSAVIAGHFHRDEMHWLGDVPLYVCPPVAGYWGRQAAFRIFEYKNGRLGYRTQYLP